MPLIARASSTVRNKNLIILAMCVGALVMFIYDGWTGYPARDDAVVKLLADSPEVESLNQKAVRQWKGWTSETPENRLKMDKIVDAAKTTVAGMNKWKTVAEIDLQRDITYGLVLINVLALWWFIHCQRRRVIADDATLSPLPGVVIPWDKITRIDNTKWDDVGIVQITYTAADGSAAKAKLDDYETQRKPLLEILDMLSDKAVNAEVFPKEEPKPATDSGDSPEAAAK